MQPRGIETNDSRKAADAWQPPKDVFIKIGDGTYTDVPLTWEQLSGMRKGALLRALKADEVFGHTLQCVDVDGCTVAILKGALADGKTKPDATDETNAAELELSDTVSDVARAHGTGERLFIHVRLPAPALPTASAAGAPAAGACVGLCTCMARVGVLHGVSCQPVLHACVLG